LSLRSSGPYQKRRYSRLTCEQIGEIHKLAKTEASLRQIAMQLGVAKTTVYYYAKHYCRKMDTLTGGLIKMRTVKDSP